MKSADRRTVYLAAAASLLTFAVYLPALVNGFVNWDDNLYVFGNGHIRSLGPAFLRWALTSFHTGNWHPITWISLALDHAVWGQGPRGYHLTNIVLHTLNTFLVVLLAAAVVERARAQRPAQEGNGEGRFILIAAGAAGLLFGLHPLHVESAAWVSERKDLLCAFFFLTSVLLYVRSAQRSPDEAKGVALPGRRYLLVAGAFILALLSKPMAVTLPAVLVIIDWYPLRRIRAASSLRTAIVGKLPLFLLSALFSVIAVAAQRDSAALWTDPYPLMTRTLIASAAVLGYVKHIVLPLHLLPFYPYLPDPSAYRSAGPVLAAVFLAAVTFACLLSWRKPRPWSAAWLFFLMTLLPVLGIVAQIGKQAMADRYVYLPSLGPFLLAGAGAAWLWRKASGRSAVRAGLAIAALVCCGSLALLTVRQIGVWKDSFSLWDAVIEAAPDRVPFAYNNRGLAFREAGMPEQALKDFDRAIALDQRYADAYTSRGWTYEALGRTDLALEDYARAIELDPAGPIVYNDRGMLFLSQGRPDLAVEDLTRAVAADPGFAPAYVNRGLAFEQTGDLAGALRDYTTAIFADPSFAAAYTNRGLLRLRSGRTDEALGDLDRAIELDPAGVEAHVNRGLVYEEPTTIGRSRSVPMIRRASATAGSP
jgi:tetratricopeptide (TPR) repeat protein